jgi:hypothetical protein
VAVDFYVGRLHRGQLSSASFEIIIRRIAEAIGMQADDSRPDRGSLRCTAIDDPLTAFLCAGDYENSLRPEDCLVIKRRIQEIAGRWPDEVDKQNALSLATAMSEAAFRGECFRWTFD